MTKTAWDKLGTYLKETQLLGSIQNTLYWDQNTLMPKAGSSWRAEQLTYIAKTLHRRNTSKEFYDLINSANDELNNERRKKNDDVEMYSKKKNIEILTKEFARQSCLDHKLVELLARAKSHGYEAWQLAKSESNFNIFLPSFKEIIKLRIEEANQISNELPPWETLAQPYEPDISKDWLFKIFSPLKEVIPTLLDEVKDIDIYNWDIDTSSQKSMKQLRKEISIKQSNFRKEIKKSGIDLISISTDEDFVDPLMSFFKSRENRI